MDELVADGMSASSKEFEARAAQSLPDAWAVLESEGWLSECAPAVRAALRGVARMRTFDAGQPLYLAGDEANGMFGLVDGALDISIPRADGQDFTIHRTESGFWIGDTAFVTKQFRLVSVRAAVSSRVAQLPQDELARLIVAKPEIVVELYRLTHRNFETALTLLGNLSVSSSEIRVALRLLLHDEQLPSGETWIRLSQPTLAELVALSVPTLQRALRKLEDDGLIEVGYRRIRVTDRAGLLALCGDVPLGEDWPCVR